jgi:hypothetical protein
MGRALTNFVEGIIENIHWPDVLFFSFFGISMIVGIIIAVEIGESNLPGWIKLIILTVGFILFINFFMK